MRKNEGNGGFSLIETVAGFSLMILAVFGFLTLTGAEGKRFAWETQIRDCFRQARQMALSGEGEASGKSLRLRFTLESSGPRDEVSETFEIYQASVPWEEGEVSVEFYRHE